MTDFKDLIEGHDAMVAATNGDLTPIATRLKNGSITERERKWLAGHLLGEHKPVRGRKIGSQSKNGRTPIKEKFEDNNDIDLAVWDAYFHLRKFEAKLSKEAKDEIAGILDETEKNIRIRLSRVREHLGSGKRRSDYITSSKKLSEQMKEVGIEIGLSSVLIHEFADISRTNFANIPPTNFAGKLPILLALARN